LSLPTPTTNLSGSLPTLSQLKADLRPQHALVIHPGWIFFRRPVLTKLPPSTGIAIFGNEGPSLIALQLASRLLQALPFLWRPSSVLSSCTLMIPTLFFLAQRPDPSGDRYFALLSRTHLWRPTTCEWLYVAGLWESKECNHFSRFSSAWRSIIIHSTTLLQARLENMDFRSFIVQGWNFRSKGAFWFCLHCGAVRAPPTTKVKDPHVYGSTFIYQKKTLICCFNGLWPSASALREWVNKTWSFAPKDSSLLTFPQRQTTKVWWSKVHGSGAYLLFPCRDGSLISTCWLWLLW